MQLRLCSIGAIIFALLLSATVVTSASDKKLVESVKAMEQQLGLAIAERWDLARRVRRTQNIPDNYNFFLSSPSSDGTAFAWSSYPHPYQGEKVAFLTLESVKNGIETIQVDGRVALDGGLSVGGQVIVALAIPLAPGRPFQLLAIDRRAGLVVRDLTQFVTQFKLQAGVGDIRVSGDGTVASICTSEQCQVLEIPTGRTLYAGTGSTPRLSPDGKRLAYVHNDMMWIYSFADGSTVQLLKGKRVKGLGGWSPDGRFLLAGAWTRLLSFDKDQIVVDTTTGEYARIGKLGEGDYGNALEWISTEILMRQPAN